MKGYFALSFLGHAALLAALIFLGMLWSKPKMDYYSVDLFSPATGGNPEPQSAPPPPVEPVKAPPQPKAEATEQPAPKEAIKVPSREPLRPPKKNPPKPKAETKPKSKAAFQAAMKALENEGPEGPSGKGPSAAPTSTGAGVSGEAGPAFPYPWYLKAIAEKLDKQWHPPQDYQADTVCQITFIIQRDGEVSGVSIEKRSGDSEFHQLAERATSDASPLPPLPSGFQEETLRVHMKFVGKNE